MPPSKATATALACPPGANHHIAPTVAQAVEETLVASRRRLRKSTGRRAWWRGSVANHRVRSPVAKAAAQASMAGSGMAVRPVANTMTQMAARAGAWRRV